MKTRKIPQRTCVACRATKPKRELIRVVRIPSGAVVVDRKGKVSGRGAYICPTLECFDQAVKSKKLEHALEVVLDSGIVDQLRQLVAKENISG